MGDRADPGSHPPSLATVAQELLESAGPNAPLPRRGAAGLRAFLQLLYDLRVACATLRVDQALELVATASGYAEWLRKEQRAKKDGVKQHDEDESTEEEDDDEEGDDGGKNDLRSEGQCTMEEQEKADLFEVSSSDDENSDIVPEQSINLDAVGPEAAGHDEREKTSAGDERRTKGLLPKSIAEAVAAARAFAERWECPFRRASAESERRPNNVPTLFEVCGRRLLAQASSSSAARARLGEQLPPALVDQIAAELGRCGRLQIEDFVTKVALDTKDAATATQGRRKRRGAPATGPARGVCISTIHAAKGLEWPVVFVAHFNEEFLPMSPQKVEVLDSNGRITKRLPTDAECAEHLEEERRLAHVAATRAQQRLVLTYVRTFSSRCLLPAARSSLPLPAPIEAEGTAGASVWTRILPPSQDELNLGSPSSDA